MEKKDTETDGKVSEDTLGGLRHPVLQTVHSTDKRYRITLRVIEVST